MPSKLGGRGIKIGGLIAFDDYLWDDPKYNQLGTPKTAIDTFIACNKHKLEVSDSGYQLWVKKTVD